MTGRAESALTPNRWARRDLWLVAGMSAVFALPVLLLAYPPGLDLPWHIAIAQVLHDLWAGEGGRYAVAYEHNAQLSSYVAIYYIAAALTFVVGSAVAAFKLLLAIYIVGFALAAYRLIRALGGGGVYALLAVPVAYSLTLEFGFFAFAVCYPLGFLLWALIAEHLRGERAGSRRRLASITVLAVIIGFVHPLAAVWFGGGAVVIALAVRAPRGPRWPVLVSTAAGLVPAVVAVFALSRESVEKLAGPAKADLWTRLTTHDFESPIAAIANAPRRLLGYVPPVVALLFVVFTIGVLVAVWLPQRARARSDKPTRVPLALLVAAALAYLATPYTFYWPRSVWAAQPRLLPILFVVALSLVAAPVVRPRLSRIVIACVAGATFCALCASLAPLYQESSDLKSIVARARPGAVLPLVEQARVVDREPAGLLRNVGAYVLAQHGGRVAHLPFDRSTRDIPSALFPVIATVPRPGAPPPSHPRTFDAARHPAWDQILIHDSDVGAPFDYFREHAHAFELVARRGAWRLYRRRAGSP